jgi:Tol biopolymer transport system component
MPGLQTFVYATTKDGKPVLYRFQVDNVAHKASTVVPVDTRAWPTSRTRIEGLYPSPDGKRVAVAWVYGEGGTTLSILDSNDGTLGSLFTESSGTDNRVLFLDWSPDGNGVLVLGRDANPTLRGSAWLVDINTHQFHAMNIKQITDAQQITGASFSPDGKTIVYARSECYQCGSEVWLVVLDGSNQQLLFEVPQFRVEQVLWAPNGRYIAFTQWRESEAQDLFIGGINSTVAVGELWVMDTQEGERHKLNSVLTGYYEQFGLAWSPDGKQIAFVMSDEAKLGKQLNDLHSNIYVADVNSGNVKPLTRFSHTQILAPTWSPDGSMLAFAGNPDSASGQLELWVVKADGSTTQQVDESHGLTVNTDATNVAIVWLP